MIETGFSNIEIISIVSKTPLRQFTDCREMIKYSNSFSKNLSFVLRPNLKRTQLTVEAQESEICFNCK